MDANQARRRIRTDGEFLSIIEDDPQLFKQPFIYKPLDPDRNTDSVRLVEIEPSIHHDDPLRCRLTIVKFADRPSRISS